MRAWKRMDSATSSLRRAGKAEIDAGACRLLSREPQPALLAQRLARRDLALGDGALHEQP